MKKSFFLDYFPPPGYLAMPAVGIDISDRSIKYSQLKREAGFYKLAKFGSRIVPEGYLSSGEIKNKKKLIDFLKYIRKELETEFIGVALPEEKSFLSRMKFPLMDREELRLAIESKLEEHIPLSLDNTVFDFEVLGGKKPGEVEVNVVAFPKDIVADYLEAFVGAGFSPVFFELETAAIARASVSKKEEDMPVLIVDFGKTRTTFIISERDSVFFSATINVAGEELNRALSKGLGVDEFEAERIKKESGLTREKSNQQIFDILLPTISIIKDEMYKHIAYWNSRLREELGKTEISKIYLCGGDANLFGLPEYLSYELGLEVSLANPWVNIASFEEYIPEIELRESLMYITSLGLALRSARYEYD